MKKRLFIAINLPLKVIEGIKKITQEFKVKFKDIRFSPETNWHLTIVFLGYKEIDAVAKIGEAIKGAVKEFEAPIITLNKITYGPPDKTPRMIWATTTEETSKALGTLKERVEKELVKYGIPVKIEKRLFRGHITLARFTRKPALPELNVGLNLKFKAESLDLMESHLQISGAVYETLSKFPFLQTDFRLSEPINQQS